MAINAIKRARYFFQLRACVIYSEMKQANMDVGCDVLTLSQLANKSKINEMYFYKKVILELMIDLLVFIQCLTLHGYPNSYAGSLL